MSMSMNILAILISLAMMLTGAGGEGQPAEASRTLLLHDVSFTYNGETVEFTPQLKLGASTNGEKAVFDLGLITEDDTLFPIQIGVSDAGLTALFEKSDVAVNVSASAFDSLTEQASQMMEAAMGQMQDQLGGEDSELMAVLMNEYIPAYAALFDSLKDEAQMKQLQADSQGILEEIVDRGEGTQVTELIEGESYALTAYSYSMDGAQMAALADKVYNMNDTLSNFYDAMFKLYSVLPEESGLNDVSSFADLFEKFNLDMRMDMEEKVSDDGDVDITDAVLTVDMSGMVETMAAEQAEDAEAVEIPEIPPIVMNIHSVKVDELSDVEVDYEYAIEDAGVDMKLDISAHSEGPDDMNMRMGMEISQNGEEMAELQLVASSDADDETGDITSAVSFDVEASGAEFELDATGVNHADGSKENTVSLSAEADGQSFALSFDLDVAVDAFEDKANGHEAVLVIDDFSEEGMSALGQNEEAQAAAMQLIGSLSGDAQKLMADESVGKLIGIFMAEAVETDSDADVSYDDDYDYDDDYEYEEIEDDGELPFAEPELGWLPEGWHIEDIDVDTAYDMVQITLADENNSNYGYISFFADMDDTQTNYTVADDGTVTPVQGREVIVNDYGDGGVNVTMRDSGVYTYLSFYADDIDMETVGRIVAGIKF